MNSIFRQEVLEHRRNKVTGEVFVLPSVNYQIACTAIFLLVMVMIIWLASTSYTRKERVQGWVEAKEGFLNVYSSKEGVIDKIFVKDGDEIQVGQPLLRISTKEMLSNGQMYKGALILEQIKQKKLLESQLERVRKVSELKANDIFEQQKIAKTNIDLFKADSRLKSDLCELLERKLKRLESLVGNGSIAISQLDEIKQQLLVAKSEKINLEQRVIQQSSELKNIEAQISLLGQNEKNESDLLMLQISSNSRAMLQYESEQEFIVYASKKGIVSNLQVHEGELLSNLEIPLLSIFSPASDLELQALIPMSAIGFIEIGQKLKLKYDSFPYQKFGFYSGNIISVSKGVLLPNEISRLPYKIDKAVYKITIQPDNKFIMAYGRSVDIRPGMTFKADVVLDKRSILEWLFDPILSIKGNL